MLNLVWPLSRLGGVLWGRLLPPSLPSPLPCPGRGMRDLEGLSTEVPLGSEAAPRGRWKLSPCLTPQSSLSWPVSFKLLFISMACLPACTTVPLLQSSYLNNSSFLSAENLNQSCFGSSQHQKWWWRAVPEKAVRMIRQQSLISTNDRWNGSSQCAH